MALGQCFGGGGDCHLRAAMARTASRHRERRRSSPAFYRDSTVRNEPLLAGFLVTGLALAGIGASTSTSLSLALALVGSLAGVLFVGLSTLVLHAMSTDEIRGRAGFEDRTKPPGQGGVCSTSEACGWPYAVGGLAGCAAARPAPALCQGDVVVGVATGTMI